MNVVAHFREQGSILAGTKTGECLGFQIELSINSDEPLEEISELFRLSHEMCFTEDVLTGEVEVSINNLLNGEDFPL